MDRKGVSVLRSNEILWVKFEGTTKETVLRNMGFDIDNKGYLYDRSHKLVISGDEEAVPVKAKEVLGILPGSLKVITDLAEAEEYFLDETE
jgi:hypothetical protein